MNQVLLFGVPHHDNLGDSAIAVAEKKLIEKYFPNFKYRYISEETTDKCLPKVIPFVDENDIIMFHGGGNLGNQYLYVENSRRNVIKAFPNNKIFSFPQTIFFTNNEEGKKEFEITKQIYNSHKNLILMARDKISYDVMKENFYNNQVFFTPDVVTILDESNSSMTRNGVLFIVRSDVESAVDMIKYQKISDICNKYYSNINFSDTAIKENILSHMKHEKLQDMFNKYKESELIITDRLHGMIFAAITATPCLAFDNYNHKIKSTSEWFKDLGYIKFVDSNTSFEDIEKNIAYLKNLKNVKYDNTYYQKIFDDVFLSNI